MSRRSADEWPALEAGEAERNLLECRRVGVAFIERMVAAWRNDGPASGVGGSGGSETHVVALGPMMPLAPGNAGVQRHGAFDGETDTIIVFGPSIEIPRNPS
jgi:hypothetical protein